MEISLHGSSRISPDLLVPPPKQAVELSDSQRELPARERPHRPWFSRGEVHWGPGEEREEETGEWEREEAIKEEEDA